MRSSLPSSSKRQSSTPLGVLGEEREVRPRLASAWPRAGTGRPAAPGAPRRPRGRAAPSTCCSPGLLKGTARPVGRAADWPKASHTSRRQNARRGVASLERLEQVQRVAAEPVVLVQAGGALVLAEDRDRQPVAALSARPLLGLGEQTGGDAEALAPLGDDEVGDVTVGAADGSSRCFECRWMNPTTLPSSSLTSTAGSSPSESRAAAMTSRSVAVISRASRQRGGPNSTRRGTSARTASASFAEARRTRSFWSSGALTSRL